MTRNFHLPILTIVGVFALSTTPAFPVSLPVINPGFEDTSGSTTVFNEFSFGSFAGWTLYDDPPGTAGNGASEPYYVGTLQPSPNPAMPGEFINFPDGAAEGVRVAIAYNRVGSDGQGEYGLSQTLAGTPLEPNRTYTLQVEIGNIASGVAQSGEHFNLDGFPGYRIDLLAGNVVLESDDNTLAGSIAEGTFETSTVTFTTGEAHLQLGFDLGIRLVNLNQLDPAFPTADLEVDFDNVRLDVVPATAGDFNFDGEVDAVDYAVWREGLGIAFDSGDFLSWRDNYGTPSPTATTVAPEPLTLLLAFPFLIWRAATFTSRRRSIQRCSASGPGPAHRR